MPTITVRTTPAEGFNGCPTPGRFWPEGETVVEVVDQEDDPILPVTGKPDPYQIGQKTLRQLKDGENKRRFFVVDGGKIVRQQPARSDAERVRDLESLVLKLQEQLGAVLAEKTATDKPQQPAQPGKR